MFEKIKKQFGRFMGIVDQCNGRVIKLTHFYDISSDELKNSIVPENCLESLSLMLDSGRESYSINHTNRMPGGGGYIGMDSVTTLLEDFEEVKKRIAYHASLSRKLSIKLSETSDFITRGFLTADFRIDTPFTQDSLGELIERYEKEFRVRNVQITYQNFPEYARNRFKFQGGFANLKILLDF